MKKISNYVNGVFVDSLTLNTKINPVNKKEYFYPESNNELIEDSLNSIRVSQKRWKIIKVKDRLKVFKEFALYLDKNEIKNEIINSIIFDTGKPYIEAETEIIEVQDIISYYIKIAEKVLADKRIEIDNELWGEKHNLLVFEPIGVIGIIKPWNYPFSNPLWSIIPAIIAGNAVILKPSEYSSLTANTIVDIFHNTSLPKGIFNVIYGGKDVGKKLVKTNGIDYITFTGSYFAGHDIRKNCAERDIECNLELGGNDIAIVTDEADIELAANGILWGSITNCGQVCTATKRVYVQKNVYNNFIDLLHSKLQNLKRGRDYGPIITKNAKKRILSYIDDAQKKGGLLSKTNKEDLNNNYFDPTIISNCKSNMNLFTEEVFGPIIPVFKYDKIEEVIQIIDKDVYGLGCSIWSKDVLNATKLAKKLDVGMVWINDVNIPFPQAPWVGRKHSGNGIGLSEYALTNYSQFKNIYVDNNLNKSKEWWFPYE